MRVVTWNVNGLKPTAKNVELRYGSLQAFFEELGADIICFQETKLMADAIPHSLKCVPGYESFWTCSSAKKGYSGVATYVKLSRAAVNAYDDRCLPGEKQLQQEGRMLITDHGKYVVVNVYAPNAGERPARARLGFKMDWFSALKDKLSSFLRQGKQVMLVGDLNIPRSRKDVHPAIKWDGLYSAQELSLINSLTQEYTDAWRVQHADVADVFTVWDERKNARTTNQGLRIDYTLCSPELHSKVTDCQVKLDIPQKWSDHAPVVLDLKEMPEHEASSVPPPCSLSSRSIPKNSLKSMFQRRAKPQPSQTTEANVACDQASDLEKVKEDRDTVDAQQGRAGGEAASAPASDVVAPCANASHTGPCQTQTGSKQETKAGFKPAAVSKRKADAQPQPPNKAQKALTGFFAASK